MSLKSWIWLATLLALVMGASGVRAQTADLSVTLTPSGPGSYIPGVALDLELRVRNLGPDPTNGAVVQVVVPEFFAVYAYNQSQLLGGASVVSGASGTGSDASDPIASPGTVLITLNMPAGADARFVINLVPRITTAEDPLNVTVDITDSGSATDANGANDTNTLPLGLNGDVSPGQDIGGTLCASTAVSNTNDLEVTVANAVVNTYYSPYVTSETTSRTIAAGTRCLPIQDGVGAAPTARSALQAGDKLLIVQMQNSINMIGADDDTYGTSDFGNWGVHEYVEVIGAPGTQGCVGAGLLPIRGAGGGDLPNFGLINTYVHRANASSNTNLKRTVQYVRVAQYEDVTINGGSIAAFQWDGWRGGIIAIEASGTLDLGSGASTKITASCAGFRGGGVFSFDVPNGSTNAGPSPFRRSYTTGSGLKGEGGGGTPRLVFDGSTTLDLGTTHEGYPAVTPGTAITNGAIASKGAPRGAGGGGNACATVTATVPLVAFEETGGGAGGGNGGRGGTGGTCVGDFDTGVGTADTGGIGGTEYTGFSFLGFACTRDSGGPGTESPLCAGRITMGSGGGSGAKNGVTSDVAAGGRGGGIVLINARQFVGSGTIAADGCAGQAGSLVSGGGGGGAGGTITLLADLSGTTTWAGVVVSARGGDGGDALIGPGNEERRGPGGGGGAGRVYTARTSNNSAPSISTLGGTAGVTDTDAAPALNLGAADGASFVEQENIDAYNVSPGVKPNFICASGTVPVTLSFIDAKVQGSELVVNFETASEAGTLGYRVYTDVPGAARQQLNADLLPGKGDSVAPLRYTVRGSYRGAREVWIEEVDVKGKATVYGPFPIGSPSGEQNIAVSTDWQAIQAEQTAFRASEAQAIVARRSSTGAVVELRTQRHGWYSVSFEQLVALGVDWNGVESRRIELRRGTRSIPVEVSGATWQAGSSLRFYGEQVDGSLYTDTAVYQLQLVAGNGTVMRPVYANAGNLSSVSSYLHTLVHAPNRAYSFGSPVDPWYASRLLRNANNPGTGSETVMVSDRVPATTARITVNFWGGTDYPQTADHAVRVLVNGTPVGEARFDGFDAHTLTADLPANLLQDGANTVSFQLLADTGAPADVVYLERIAIDYVRNLKLEANGSLVFGAAQGAPGVTDGDRIFAGDFSAEGTPACSGMTPGCAAYAVQVGSSTARAFRIRDGVAQPLTTAVNAGVLRFAALAQPGDQFRVETAAAAPALRVAEPVGDLFGGLSAVDYLVISHPSFSAGLQPLLVARQTEGLRTHVVNVEDLYRAYTGGEFGPAAVEAFLRESYQRWPMLRYVLFVGGDTYDYKNHSGLNSIGFVPTHYRETSEFVRYAPTDTVYADVNGDGVKELAIGRFPVRTAAELANVVAKTLAYPTAGHANQLVWVTDRESNSYNYRSISGNFTAGFTSWTKQFVDLNTYPTSGGAASARGELVTALNGGKALLGYYGHSSPSSWTREGLLTATLVNGGLFNNATRPTALFQLGCWGAYFVDPQYSSLSHAFLLRPSGAAAVIAATALTEVSSDELFSSVALPSLRQGRRIGDVVRDSANAIRLSPASAGAMDVIIGTTVLGDPALRINVQQQ
jgi:hypothetical protein